MSASGSTGRRLGVVLGSGAAEVRAALAPELEVEILLRHDGADGRFVPAHLVDHATNVRALAAGGCDRVLSINSVGSLRPDWGVGTVMAPHDFLALGVTPSLFDDERGHSVPGFAAAWRARVVAAWTAAPPGPLAAIVDGGVYAQTTGPRFETPAEVRMLATFADVVGMTVAAECILAREAGLAYAAVCVVDNLANGLSPDGDLAIEEFAAGKEGNRAGLERILPHVIGALA